MVGHALLVRLPQNIFESHACNLLKFLCLKCSQWDNRNSNYIIVTSTTVNLDQPNSSVFCPRKQTCISTTFARARTSVVLINFRSEYKLFSVGRA